MFYQPIFYNSAITKFYTKGLYVKLEGHCKYKINKKEV